MAQLRRVARLLLRADDRDAVRGLLPRLEDAMRTASLPDAASRILLVRRLELGLIDRDATAMSLSRRIEQSVQRSDIRCCHAADPQAGDAAIVWFRDALDAHTHLALRLVNGPPPTEWFWRLAVPVWHERQQGTAALRLLAYSLAGLPEAAVALPAWCAALAGAGRMASLLAALHDSDVEILAKAAGLPAELDVAASPRAQPTVAMSDQVEDVRPHHATVSDTPRLRLIARLLQAADHPLPEQLSLLARSHRHRTRRSASPQPSPNTPVTSRLPLHLRSVSEHATPGQASVDHRQASAARTAVKPPGVSSSLATTTSPDASPDDPKASIAAPRRTAPAEPLQRSRNQRASGEDQPTFCEANAVTVPAGVCTGLDSDPGSMPYIDAEATAAGGLLLLLNVLARLGYPEWLASDPAWREQRLLERILLQVLMSLDVTDSDPIRSLFGPAAGSTPPVPDFEAPQRWQQGLLVGRGPLRLFQGPHAGALFDPAGRLLLRSWHGECPAELARQSLPVDNADVRPDWRLIERNWHTAMRRWLRRFAHIGIADMVLRPALLTATPTHCDLYFEHKQADIRIRRAGLDMDPGWLPWFGRVVGFHYGQEDITR